MRRRDSLLRSGGIGTLFLVLAIGACVASGSPAWLVLFGLVIGLLAMTLLIATGQAVPGGRTRQGSKAVGIGATIGGALVALLSSWLGLIDPSAPRLFAVAGPAAIAGFALGVIPSLLRTRDVT